MAKDPVTLPLGTIATEFGMSRDVLRRILSEAGVAPVGKRSGHPVYRLRDVYEAVQRQGEPEQMNPHARLALARAIKTEDEIRARRGELVERFDVEQRIGTLFKIQVRAFDVAPDILERDIGLSPKQAARLEQHFDAAREQLYREVTGDDGKGGPRPAGKRARGNRGDHDGANGGPGSTGRVRAPHVRKGRAQPAASGVDRGTRPGKR